MKYSDMKEGHVYYIREYGWGDYIFILHRIYGSSVYSKTYIFMPLDFHARFVTSEIPLALMGPIYSLNEFVIQEPTDEQIAHFNTCILLGKYIPYSKIKEDEI